MMQMFRKISLLLLSVMVSVTFVQNTQAKRKYKKPTKAQKEAFESADKNDDGVIDNKEWRKEKRRQKRSGLAVNTWLKKKADTDQDGKVSSEEASIWENTTRQKIDVDADGVISPKEQRLSWKHEKAKVNTRLESHYDYDRNGWLEPDEVRDYLSSRYAIVQSKGIAKVDSAIEEEYDIDKDGILNIQEAKTLKEDLE